MMLPTQTAADTAITAPTGEPALPLELLELELSLDGFSGDEAGFAAACAAASRAIGTRKGEQET
jgi:hypothetical protein